MRPRNLVPWLVLLASLAWTWLNREVVSFALRDGPGLLGFGQFGVLEERRLGLLGRDLARQDRPQEAAAAFRASLSIDPRGEYRRDLALSLVAQGDALAAERELRLHLESFPRDAFAALTLALLREGQGAGPAEVRGLLLRARDAVLAERRDLEAPAAVFPPGPAEKHARSLRELARLGEWVERELARLASAEPSGGSREPERLEPEPTQEDPGGG